MNRRYCAMEQVIDSWISYSSFFSKAVCNSSMHLSGEEVYYHRCFMWRLSTAACTCQERKCITTGVLCGGCQHLSGEEVYYHRCFTWRLSTAACTCQEGKCITTGVLCGGCQHLSVGEVYYYRCFMWRLSTAACTCQERKCITTGVFVEVVNSSMHLSGVRLEITVPVGWALNTNN